MTADGNYYLVLELKPGSSLAEIKIQYRLLAKRYHPDLHGNDPQSQEKFRRVHAAYEFLSDPARKAAYDRSLLTPKAPPPSPAKAAPPPAPKPAPNAARPRPIRLPDYPPPPRNLFEALGEIKASRSVWFSGAAIAVVLLLGIGFCWENGVGEHEEPSGAAFAFSPDEGHSQLEPDGDIAPAAAPPEVPLNAVRDKTSKYMPDTPPIVPLPLPSRRFTPAKKAHRIVPSLIPVEPPKKENAEDKAGTASSASKSAASAAVAVPELISTRDLVPPLLARYRAVVPQVDLLINRGYALCDADQNDGRTQRLKADLARLDAVRDRVRPEIERLPRRADAEELSRELKPILADLRQLEANPQPVREDIQTLALMPATN